MPVRALLDSASFTSFITVRLVERLRLSQRHCSVQVAGVDGLHQSSPSCLMVGFRIEAHSMTDQGVKSSWNVETVVLHRITTNLPSCPVPLERNWKLLAGLQLADPDFGIPGHINILLGIDVFNGVILHSWQNSLVGSPSAHETSLGWVLSGTILPKRTHQ